MLENIFSIEYENEKHKVIRFFGIKIKLKLNNKELIALQKAKGNNFLLHKENGEIVEFPEIENLNVKFLSTNSIVEIWGSNNFINIFGKQSCIVINGDNNHIEIKKTNSSIAGLCISLYGNNNKLFIDENIYVDSSTKIEFARNNNLTVKIGKDCLFAANTTLLTGDYHTVYSNSKPEKVLNHSYKGITIGDHVWVSRNAVILKDVTIASNNIIGTNSIVTKSFEKENTLIAGIPAKVVREDVNFDSRNTKDYIASFD